MNEQNMELKRDIAEYERETELLRKGAEATRERMILDEKRHDLAAGNYPWEASWNCGFAMWAAFCIGGMIPVAGWVVISFWFLKLVNYLLRSLRLDLIAEFLCTSQKPDISVDDSIWMNSTDMLKILVVSYIIFVICKSVKKFMWKRKYQRELF